MTNNACLVNVDGIEYKYSLNNDKLRFEHSANYQHIKFVSSVSIRNNKIGIPVIF